MLDLGEFDYRHNAKFLGSRNKALWRYMVHRPDNGEPWLWLTEEERQLRAEGIQQMVQRLLVRSGLRCLEGCIPKFRHTFAINFLHNGSEMPQLQYLLGHSTLEMTKRYVATPGLMDVLSAHEKASPVDAMDLA